MAIAIIVIMDYFSKWAEAIAVPNQTAVKVAFIMEFQCMLQWQDIKTLNFITPWLELYMSLNTPIYLNENIKIINTKYHNIRVVFYIAIWSLPPHTFTSTCVFDQLIKSWFTYMLQSSWLLNTTMYNKCQCIDVVRFWSFKQCDS